MFMTAVWSLKSKSGEFLRAENVFLHKIVREGAATMREVSRVPLL